MEQVTSPNNPPSAAPKAESNRNFWIYGIHSSGAGPAGSLGLSLLRVSAEIGGTWRERRIAPGPSAFSWSRDTRRRECAMLE